jgi:hypothetical protein
MVRISGIVRSLKSRQNCVIPIILEQCEIANKLKHLTYLDLTLDNNTLTELITQFCLDFSERTMPDIRTIDF